MNKCNTKYISNTIPITVLISSKPARQTVQQYHYFGRTMNYCVTNADVTESNAISFRVVSVSKRKPAN